MCHNGNIEMSGVVHLEVVILISLDQNVLASLSQSIFLNFTSFY